MGACDRAITVTMPGGTIGIVIDEDFAIRMSSPATRVGVYFMDHALPTQILPEGA